MSTANRTVAGGRIDRNRPLRFTFDGKPYTGFAGDTLASALIANGVHLISRSFKYHRPRGILTAGAEEPNALVGVGADEAHYTPNLRATQVELYDGLVAESQNRWPSLRFDAAAVNDLLAPLFPAGFYYKTFMWPASFWHKFYEPKIRAMAGIGRTPKTADADRYLQRYAHTDVVVIGAGPAGIAAALAASESGAKVMLVDEQAEFGGSLLSDVSSVIDGQPAQSWLAQALATLKSRPNVTLLPRTTGFGYYAQNMVGLAERVTEHLADPDPNLPRERLWQVRAKRVVLATGAIERPLVFPDNDRPGIMLANAGRTYVNRYGVKPGRRAVVFTAHDSAYRAAVDLAAQGVAIAAIVDLRPAPSGPLVQAARAAGLPIRTNATIVKTQGRLGVTSVTVATLAADGTVAKGGDKIACDLVLMSGGFTPTVHLFSQSRGKLGFDDATKSFIPATSVQDEVSVGAARGGNTLAEALADGQAAGEKFSGELGLTAPAARRFAVEALEAGIDAYVGAVPHNRDDRFVKAFVDYQHDVTSKDVKLATREGLKSIEHIKRYTTTGMATDQGKSSNINALAIASKALGKSIPEVGLTTFRHPYTPTTFGIFAGLNRGKQFDPARETPIHGWAEEQGAVFEDVSLWKRARYFPQNGEDMHAAVNRECVAVRDSVGIFDASTLGKIEVVGPDAAEFMNRMYVNAWTKLEPGRLRYGVMLREDGFVMDDGVVGRMAPDRFHVTTTTGGAARVLNFMEDYLQTEWSDLNVWLTSTTEQWAVIAVQGPNARKVIEPLVEGIDLSPESMPHMSVKEGKICGVPTRLFRVSFTGELGFEINVPADYGRAVWEAVYAAGQAYGITPYGTETMHVLRAEKGYIIVGQETDGTATPDDVNLGWAVSKIKKDFVGKRSLALPDLARKDRKQLVGLVSIDGRSVLEEGAQIVADPNQPKPMTMLGHVTSAYYSAVLKQPIALAMIRNGRARLGETLYLPMPGQTIAVKVVEPVFYDPKGDRLNG